MLRRHAALPVVAALLTLSAGSGAMAVGRAPATLDDPVSCENPVPAFDAAAQRQMVAKLKTANTYFMTSPDLGVTGSYEDRKARFDSTAVAELRSFRDQRLSQYRATVCQYAGSRSTSGRNARSRTTLTAATGHYLLPATLERTTNGDWKGGPTWGGPAGEPTSITWVTGGYRPASTFVRIKGRYSESFLVARVRQELDGVRKELADAGVATPDPAS